MDEDQLTAQQAQDVWNEEAAKLSTEGEQSPPVESSQASAPDQDPPPDDSTQAPELEDPYGSLPQAVREKLAQFDQLASTQAQVLQHLKSAEGRVAAMQRELQVAKAAQQVVAPKDAPSQTQIAAAAKNPEKWDNLRKDFPEWGEAIEEFVAAKMGGQADTPRGIDPRLVEAYVAQQAEQTQQQTARLIEEVRLEGRHPTWREDVATPEFQQWMSVQPADTQALAESWLAKDAGRMLDLFKARNVADIRSERGQRLAAAATGRPGSTRPAKTLDDLSPAELWKYEARKRDEARSKRGY